LSLLQRFTDFIKKENLFSPKDKLLLAVSGGVDSVVLCELCKQAGYDFSIAHCNFQLRGEESERDEQFVRSLSDKYKVEVKVKKFETEKYAEENKLSIQEAARELRYRWFAELVNGELSMVNKKYSNNIHHSPFTIHLLTAHHADDNAETVLMNYLRGTGLHGLTGIPVSNDFIRRPMLSFTKDEILQFAKESNLEFVEDSSNQSSKYARNLFRNEIIPAISKAYPQVKENLVDNISRFKEIEKLYKLSVAEIKKKLIRKKGAEHHIPIKQLTGYYNRALIYEIIADFGFTEKQIDEVTKLAESESGRYIDSPALSYRLIKHRHWFIISPVSPAESTTIIIEKKDKAISFEKGTLQIEVTSNQQPRPTGSSGRAVTSNQLACLDAKKIHFPLILRKWKQGDYFYPLGMKNLSTGKVGKKKLSRFFIDNKFSKTDKEKVWVIESDKRILWIVGHRIDERFKITDKTKSVVKLTLNSQNE
jgi:tRNA(Ile)-lysidine synthase